MTIFFLGEKEIEGSIEGALEEAERKFESRMPVKRESH